MGTGAVLGVVVGMVAWTVAWTGVVVGVVVAMSVAGARRGVRFDRSGCHLRVREPWRRVAGDVGDGAGPCWQVGHQ
ncbi:hypothetical protein SUDANB145_01899 [Streptomyces sp. enrichment culture]